MVVSIVTLLPLLVIIVRITRCVHKFREVSTKGIDTHYQLIAKWKAQYFARTQEYIKILVDTDDIQEYVILQLVVSEEIGSILYLRKYKDYYQVVEDTLDADGSSFEKMIILLIVGIVLGIIVLLLTMYSTGYIPT